jgi:hypothetical protein
MSTFKAENTELFIGGQKVAELEDVEFDYSTDPGPSAAMLGPVEFFETVVNIPLDARQHALLMAAITPDGVPHRIRAGLGVFVWRMLGDLHLPYMRRRGNGAMWRQALRASQQRTLDYLMTLDEHGAERTEASP